MRRIALLLAAHPASMIEFARTLAGQGGWWLLSYDASYDALRAANILVQDARSLFGRAKLDPSIFRTANMLELCLRMPASVYATTALAGIGLVGMDLLYFDPSTHAEPSSPSATAPDAAEQFDADGAALLTAAADGRKYVLTTPEQGRLFLRYLDAGEPNAAHATAVLGRHARWLAAQCLLAAARRHGPTDGTGAITVTEGGVTNALLIPVH